MVPGNQAIDNFSRNPLAAAHDVLIAAQARRHGATLVTANQREFARVPGLDVVDWATPEEV